MMTKARPVSSLSPDDLRALVTECVAVVKPGEVLAVRLPTDIDSRQVRGAREYGQQIERETGVKVAFIPGEEFAHVTVNIHVNGVTGSEELAAEIRRQMYAYAQRNASAISGRATAPDAG
jgi:hypothetical protein